MCELEPEEEAVLGARVKPVRFAESAAPPDVEEASNDRRDEAFSVELHLLAPPPPPPPRGRVLTLAMPFEMADETRVVAIELGVDCGTVGAPTLTPADVG